MAQWANEELKEIGGSRWLSIDLIPPSCICVALDEKELGQYPVIKSLTFRATAGHPTASNHNNNNNNNNNNDNNNNNSIQTI